jgi:hypothetical protein
VSSSFARARGRKDRGQVAAFSLALDCCSGRWKRRSHDDHDHHHGRSALVRGCWRGCVLGTRNARSRRAAKSVEVVVMMSVRYSVILGFIGTNGQIARVLAVQCD